MPRQFLAAAGSLALLGLAGCQTTPPLPCEAPAAYNAQAAQTVGIAPAAPQPMTSIGRAGARVLDGVTNLVHVDDVRAGRRPNGAVEVAARITNCTGAPLQVEGATQFFDAGGSSAEPPTVWKRVFIPPRTSRDYQELSTGSRPATFVIELRGGT